MAITKEDIFRADWHSWLLGRYLLPTGDSYTFKGFEYLEDITKHKWKPYDEIFVIKPSQVGVSELMLSLPVWMNCRNLPKWKGCGYFFPAREQLQDHIKARFLPMFDYDSEKSRYLQGKLGQQNLRYISINKKPIYFRSGQTRRELISIALDAAIIDEFDEFENPISVVPTLEARFGQSDYGFLFGGSTPTMPEIGIDAAYTMSNQHNWYIPCDVCGVEFSPLREVKLTGIENTVVRAPITKTVGFICPNCHDLTQTNGKPGRWIMDEPKDNQKYGYAISRLFTSRHKLSKLLEEYELALNLQEFYNSTLGIAYAPKNSRLQRSAIFNCANGPEQMPTHSKEETWMGIDVGNKCHWAVGTQSEFGKITVLAYGSDPFDNLQEIVRRYNVTRCVIDLMPFADSVKKFIAGRRGFLACEFNTSPQEDWFKIMSVDREGSNTPLRLVKTDKTQSCDKLIYDITEKQKFIFPSCVKGDNVFINQLCAPVRQEKTDKDRGDVRAIYGNGGRADHYFFALVYLNLAFQMKRSSVATLSDVRF